jgi:hypothetical protein
MNNVIKKVWKLMTSQHVIVAFNVIGLALQIAHQVEGLKKGNRQVGFSTKKNKFGSLGGSSEGEE